MKKISVGLLSSHISSVIRHLEAFNDSIDYISELQIFIIKPKKSNKIRFVLINLLYIILNIKKLSLILNSWKKIHFLFESFDDFTTISKIESYQLDVGLH